MSETKKDKPSGSGHHPASRAALLANRQSGIKKPRKILTKQERLFCVCYVEKGNAHKAAEMVGLHPKTGYYLLKLQRIQDYLPKVDERMLDEAVEYFSKKLHVAVEHIDRELLKAIRQKNGYAKNEAIELAYERTGVLARKGSTNVSATANAGAIAGVLPTGAPMKQVYKSRWLRDTEEKLATEIAQEYLAERDQPRLPGNTETQAE